MNKNSSSKRGKTELTTKHRFGLAIFVKVSARFGLSKTFFEMANNRFSATEVLFKDCLSVM